MKNLEYKTDLNRFKITENKNFQLYINQYEDFYMTFTPFLFVTDSFHNLKYPSIFVINFESTAIQKELIVKNIRFYRDIFHFQV